jgi:hypothetical protein
LDAQTQQANFDAPSMLQQGYKPYPSFCSSILVQMARLRKRRGYGTLEIGQPEKVAGDIWQMKFNV